MAVAETVTDRVETLNKLESLSSTEQCTISHECDSRRLVLLQSDGSGGSGLPGVSNAAHSSQKFTSSFVGSRRKSVRNDF